MSEKRGQKRVRISDPFLGPFSIGTLSTGPKAVPFPGPNFGRRGAATPSLWSSLLESQNLGADQKSVPDAAR